MKKLLASFALSAAVSVLTGVSSQLPAVASTPRYSDQQVFEGIIFGYGPVAAAIPNYGAPTNTPSPVQRRAAISVALQIEKMNPHAIARFAAAATSGDPGRVSTALYQVAHEIEILVKQGQLKMVRHEGGRDYAAGGIAVVQAFTQDQMVTDFDLGTVTTQIAFIIRTPQHGRAGSIAAKSVLVADAAGQLERERIVSTIAAALRRT